MLTLNSNYHLLQLLVNIEAGKDKEGKGFDPRKLLAPGKAAIVEDAKSHIDWFGSANKA